MVVHVHRNGEAFEGEFMTRDGNTLTVIMSDPLDEDTIKDLDNFFGCKIEPAIATRAEILRTIGSYFHKVELGPEAVLETEDKLKDLVIGGKELTEQEAGDKTVDIVNFVISSAVLEDASDIHIEPMEKCIRIRYRIDGILQHKTDLPRSLIQPLTSRIKVLCGLDIAERRRHQDGRIEARVMGKEVDLRVSTSTRTTCLGKKATWMERINHPRSSRDRLQSHREAHRILATA